MIDYLELFNGMLETENGEQEVADYLMKVADAANSARLKKQQKVQKEEAIEALTLLVDKYFGEFKIFTLGNYRPKDAVEAMVTALEDMEKMVSSSKEMEEWLRNCR